MKSFQPEQFASSIELQMSLYRTYRPQEFADVIGQDHVVTTLEQAVKQDRLAHAYLFAGSRGTGKTSVARILAKAIMTKNVADETLKKQIAKGVQDGSIVDLIEIDAASNRGIDDVRDLIEKIQFSPVVASAKVYIIDEVHMLTKEAFNALLKTLEEPPSYAYFILATTELHKIPSTIQSRCQCFPFRRIKDDDIIRRLQFITDTEKLTVERDALRTIAKHVNGGMRDAISLLDQMRSIDNVTADAVESRLGATGSDSVDPLLSALADNDSAAILSIVRSLEENGVPLDTFVRQLLQAIRDQMYESVSSEQPIQWHHHSIQTLLSTLRDIRTAPVPGLALESALLSLLDVPASAPATKPVVPAPKVTKSEPVPTAAKEPEAPKPAEPAETKTTPTTFEAAELSKESLQVFWPTLLKETQPASARLSLKDGQIIEVKGTTVTIGFSSAFHRDKVCSTEASRSIEDLLEKQFNQNIRINCTLGNSTPKPTSDDDAVNLAEAAAEIF